MSAWMRTNWGFSQARTFFRSGLFQLPLGILLDRYGPRRVNASLLVVAACGGLVFGLSESLPGLVTGRALIGFGVSGCLMASMKAFTLWFPMQRFATLNGALMAIGGLGAVSASAPVEAALRLTDWRGLFEILAALTFATSMLIFFVVPERADARASASVRELVAGFATIFRDAAFWRVGMVSLTVQGTFLAMQGLWVAPWLRDVAGHDRTAVANILLAMAVATTIGFGSFGALSDWLARRGIAPLAVYKWGALTSALILASFSLGVTSIAVPAWLLFALASPATTLSYAILTRRYDKGLVGRVSTAVNMLVFIGAFAAQWGVGAIVSLWLPGADGRYPFAAYVAGFGACFIAQALTLAPLFAIRQMAPRRS